MKSIHIRVAYEFKKLIYKIRAKEMLMNGREVSCEEITRRLIKYLNWEKIWEDEFAKK